MIRPSIIRNLLFIIMPIVCMNAQVGIGTTNPLETLHVAGTMRVTNTNSTTAASILGIDINGTIQQVALGNTMTLVNGVLNANLTSSVISFGFADINVSGFTGNQTLDLDLDGANEDIVFFRLIGSGSNEFTLSGIQDGTDGRHIYILFRNTGNIQFTNAIGTGGGGNLISNLTNSSDTNGEEAILEFVYDASIQRWILFDIARQ